MKTTDAQFVSMQAGMRKMEGHLKRVLTEVERSLYAWAFVDGWAFQEKEISQALARSKPDRIRKGNQ